jgi:hypothetical protein
VYLGVCAEYMESCDGPSRDKIVFAEYASTVYVYRARRLEIQLSKITTEITAALLGSPIVDHQFWRGMTGKCLLTQISKKHTHTIVN